MQSINNDLVLDDGSAVTVAVAPHDFGLALSADPSPADVGDTVSVTAAIDQSLYGTGLSLQIRDLDDENKRTVGACSGTSCRYTFYPSLWSSDNERFQVRHFDARVITSDDQVVSSPKEVAVDIRPVRFEPALTFTDRVAESDGRVTFTARATATPSLNGTPYGLDIVDDSDTKRASCYATDVCTASVEAGRSYRAVVTDPSGTIFGASSWYEVDTTGAQETGDLNLEQLAALFPDPLAVCIVLNRVGVRTTSSISSLAEYCLNELAGLSTREVLGRIAERGGAGALAALAAAAAIYPDRTSDGVLVVPPYQPGQPPPPPPPAPWPSSGTPPATYPPVLEDAANRAADAILARNPPLSADRATAKAQAQEIARQCVWLASVSILDQSICFKHRLPIFVTGGNVMDATRHDLEAIVSPGGIARTWFSLNYDGVTKPRGWLLRDPRCEGRVGGDTGLQCDEYPFNVTEQGGQSNDPSLRPVSKQQNLSQGGTFGAGVKSTACAMRSASTTAVRGDAFIVVPVPVEAVPTTWICNGKSVSSQPPQPPASGG